MMIKLLGVEKLDDKTYSVQLDNHGVIKSYRFAFSWTTIDDVSFVCARPLGPEIVLDLWDYNLKEWTGPSAGAVNNPITNRIGSIIGDIEWGKSFEFPIVLHPDPEGA